MLKESTINSAEIEKFNKLADDWSDNQGAYKILYEINPLRISYILDKIVKHFKLTTLTNNFNNLSVADIGCGGGLVSTELSKLGFNVTGIDASIANIEQAKNYAKLNSVTVNFQQGEITRLLVSNNKKYDIIICLELIEHLDNLPYFFNCLSKLLKPNGMIIISTINRTTKAFVFAIVLGEYFLKWVPINTHSYNKFVKPSEIQNYLTKDNLTIKSLIGLNYNVLTKEWKLDNNVDVNYFAYIINKSSA